MTTASWTSTYTHSSDANFRLWGKDISDTLQACGLVKTSDTGQIDWATVTIPGTNTNAGYEVYYLNDSLHSTYPIYIKLWYGTGSLAAYPRMEIQLGTGSDGSGALTGYTSNVLTSARASAASSSSETCRACVTEGMFFVMYKQASTLAQIFLGMARTSASDGSLSGVGAVVFSHCSNNSTTYSMYTQSWRPGATSYKSAELGNSQTNANGFFWFPGDAASLQTQGGDLQITPCMAIFPEILPCLGLGAAPVVDLSVGATVTATPAGSTSHTFIQLGVPGGRLGAREDSTNDNEIGLLALWE